MAFKPNYNFQKAERNRAKLQKKQEKLKRKQEARGDAPEDGTAPGNTAEAEPVTAETSADAEKGTDEA
ncbi:MAG TPA: hypothetical protein VMW57_04490 [Methyloceanibacter sp.]|nr:hypothetical protein [Methyloceanibacter sp.]